MAKTLINSVVKNTRTIDGMQKRRNSSIVTIVGQEHKAANNGVVYFALSPDMVIISELRFKIIGTASFSNVILDGNLNLGWSGASGVSPDDGPNNFFDLLASLSGTGISSSFFNGGVHHLQIIGGGDYKILMYAKYSARNR